jgi:hypothetical protein
MQRKRRGRRGRGNGNNGKEKNGQSNGGDGDKLRIRVISYLDGYPGNQSVCTGEPIFMISIADRDGSIETIAINVPDTKKLIIDGLITLREAHQPFAAYLIDRYFRQDSPHPHDGWGDADS